MKDFGQFLSDHHINMKAVMDTGAVATMLGTLAGWLPNIAALFTIIWTATRIWEALTGQPFSKSRLARWVSGNKD